MASLSEQKIKEMEAEMNRFEQEIETAVPDHIKNRIIIGAQTYSKVQDQLTSNADTERKFSNISAPPPPPPPPLQLLPKPDQNNAPLHGGRNDRSQNVVLPSGQTAPFLPPPPPPPAALRPSFVPPQLRNRAPMHYPPRPMNMPPRPIPGQFAPLPPRMGTPAYGVQTLHAPPQNGFSPFVGAGPPVGYAGPPAGGGPMQMLSIPSTQSSPVTEKPKIIYSAPPVRLVPKTVRKKSEKKKAIKIEESDSKIVEDIPVESAPVEESIEMEISALGDVDLEELDEAGNSKSKGKKKSKFVRTAAGQVWEDPSLLDWDPDDFRMFCGDLGNEVTDDTLQRAFSRYPSFKRAKVVRDKRSNKTKGYGFVSFSDPGDFARAMREINGKYVGNRPIKLRKSNWKDRNIDMVRRKEKEKKRLGFR